MYIVVTIVQKLGVQQPLQAGQTTRKIDASETMVCLAKMEERAEERAFQ